VASAKYHSHNHTSGKRGYEGFPWLFPRNGQWLALDILPVICSAHGLSLLYFWPRLTCNEEGETSAGDNCPCISPSPAFSGRKPTSCIRPGKPVGSFSTYRAHSQRNQAGTRLANVSIRACLLELPKSSSSMVTRRSQAHPNSPYRTTHLLSLPSSLQVLPPCSATSPNLASSPPLDCIAQPD